MRAATPEVCVIVGGGESPVCGEGLRALGEGLYGSGEARTRT